MKKLPDICIRDMILFELVIHALGFSKYYIGITLIVWLTAATIITIKDIEDNYPPRDKP